MATKNNFDGCDCDSKMIEIYEEYQKSGKIFENIKEELAKVECGRHIGRAYFRVKDKMIQDGLIPQNSGKLIFVLKEKSCNHNNYYCVNCDTYFTRKLKDYFNKKGIEIKDTSNEKYKNVNNDKEWQI